MESHQPDHDPNDPTPKQKRKTVIHITLAVIAFLIFVLLYMSFNVEPDPAELPIHTDSPAGKSTS